MVQRVSANLLLAASKTGGNTNNLNTAWGRRQSAVVPVAPVIPPGAPPPPLPVTWSEKQADAAEKTRRMISEIAANQAMSMNTSESLGKRTIYDQ